MLKSYCLLLLSLLCLESVGQNLSTQTRTKLPSPINTNGDEGGSIISRDGKMLVFIRAIRSTEKKVEQEDQQDVFISRRGADGSWSTPEAPGAPINSPDEDNTCAGMGTDGNTLYLINLVRTKRSLNRGISVSRNDGTAWSAPQQLNIPAKIPPIGFFGAYVAPDESYVIISAAIQGSKGEEDLFVTVKNADGSWGELQHMGDQINSRGYETTPFMAPDGKTIYFSSNGFPGLGDADIFRSQRTGESWTSWSVPENLGPKINTAGFDASFSVDDAGNAYFTSGEGANPGPGDLYGMNITDLFPKKEAVAAATPPVDTTGKAATDPAKADPAVANNTNAANAATGNENAGGATSESAGNTGTSSNAGNPGTKGTKGTKGNTAGNESSGGSESGSAVDASNLPKAYFETNSADLGDEYRTEIVNAVSGLLKGRKAYVTVYGFADNVGNNAYNMTLSKRRAQAVKKALVASGISSSKIKTRGFGEARPAGDNETEDGRKQNRRVEIHMSR